MTMELQVMTVEQTAINVVGGNNPFNASVFANWINFCDVQPATQRTYNKAIQSFALFLSRTRIATPSREDVIAYRDSLLAEGKKVSSARLYLTVVKNFFRFLASKNLYANVADGVKLPAMPTDEHARDALSLDEAKAALNSFKGTSEKELRDRCIMALMIGAGLRSIEICRLDCGDFEKRRGQWFIKVHGKARAGKTDSVAISTELKKIVDDYLAVRKNAKKGTPLFVSTANRNKGCRLETQTVSRLAKKVFASIGIDSERITCHSCRHACATLMLEAGVPMRQVSKIMRHRSLVTTEIYSHDIDAFNNHGVQILSKQLFA